MLLTAELWYESHRGSGRVICRSAAELKRALARTRPDYASLTVARRGAPATSWDSAHNARQNYTLICGGVYDLPPANYDGDF